MNKNRNFLILKLLLICASGCASATTGHPSHSDSSVNVERGRPNRVVDGVGWFLGIPSKLAIWDRRADNHDISGRTESEIKAYLEQQQLSSVLVRVNQYDPVGEWQRLATNRHIGLGWRLTGGTIETLKYTLLPGRLLGEDWYNPFTDTVNLYSDIPSIAIAEAAYAREVHERQHPGAYATTQIFPIANMWHKSIATREALDYVSRTGSDADNEEAYRVLYPSYGGSWGAGIGSFVPFASGYARFGGAVVGHAANGIRMVSANEEKSGDVDSAP